MDNQLRKTIRWLISHPHSPTNTIQNDVRDLDSGIYRNMPCGCGSRIKYKFCCMPNQPKTMETLLAKKLADKEVKYYAKKYKEKVNGLVGRHSRDSG